MYLCIVYAYTCLYACVWNYSVYVGFFFFFGLVSFMFTFHNYLEIVTFVDDFTESTD